MASKTGVILPYNFKLSKQDNLTFLKETFKRLFPKRDVDRCSFNNFWSPPQKEYPYMYLFTSMFYPDFMTESEYEKYLGRKDIYMYR